MQCAKHFLVRYYIYTGKKNWTEEGDKRRVAFGKICYYKILNRSRFAKKAA